ncbi:MAG: HEAT repeat domain-containing protein [Phycisphaeraceae bacterium]
MKTASHNTLTPTLWLALAAMLLTMALWPALSRAADEDEGAHGGDNQASNDDALHQPGPAVRAPRTTQRFTEQGQTLNPIAMSFDSKGNLYIAEGWRAGNAVLDNRNGPLRRSGGVIHDLQKTSVQDRAQQIKMLIEGGFYPAERFTKEADKVRYLADTDNDGKADVARVFADGFNDPLDGIASGVLVHDGKVYLTNIPHLWLLEDKDGDGDADKTTPGERTSLSYGWGIRWAFYGHDMHGLIKGPDGRIYFSIGDRGYNVKTQEGKHLYGPDRGAVFRMWPDGSGLELYFEGLRNPQELAFDNYGNLFTGDNNCDAGDLARFAFLPEGGDAGWRQDVQSLPHRGPWHREHIWKPRFEKDDPAQPAWIIPPVANVGRGPSGLVHYPGTGDAFPANGSFLLCDYPAGVRHVLVEPDGATFKVVEDSKLPADGNTITDVAWGYDGKLYLSDWGGGWSPNPNGYIKTMTNRAAHAEQAEAIKEVQALFAEGFEKLDHVDLVELLAHEDQRVRLAAQYELATRKTTAAYISSYATRNEAPALMRLHAYWALGMMARNFPVVTKYIEDGLSDPDHNIRAQAVLTLGDLHHPASSTYRELLKDESVMVRHHAAIALGKTGSTTDIPAILNLLERNNNNDVVIRHAASYALSLIGDAEAIHEEAKRRGSAARLGAVLALRRLDSPLLAEYLDDEDTLVAAEAARAIYDKRIMDAMPALAQSLDTLPTDRMIEPIMRRVIEANVRLADRDCALRLGRLAANAEAPQDWRLLALDELDGWSAERYREGVWGSWWPRPKQTMDDANAAMLAYLPTTAKDANPKLATRARTLMQKHVAKSSPKELAEIALNADEPAALRLSTLQLLADADRTLAIATAQAIADMDADPDNEAEGSANLRIAARLLLINLDTQAGQESYARAIKAGTLAEQQDAIDRLGRGAAVKGAIPGGAFVELTDALKRGELAPELRLDVVEAVSSNQAMPLPARVAVQQYVEKYRIPGEEPFVRDAVLVGGSVAEGKNIFYNHDAAQCQRCHNVGGPASVGPDMGGIGHKDLNYLYTALVKPHADIAEGYATTTVTLKNGAIASGRIVKEKSTPAQLVLANADGVEQGIARDQIQGVPVTSDQSLMPTMTDKLSPAELRDVLAYLASLKGDGTAASIRAAGASTGPAGPYVVSPAKDMPHFVYLPAMLLGIFALLGVLLLITVLGGKSVEEHAT